MKKTLEFYTQYNKKANAAMIHILSGLAPELLRKDLGTFFKTIIDTFNHSIYADILWLKRFSGFVTSPALKGSELLARDIEELYEKCKTDASFALAAKTALDDLLIAFVGEAGEADLVKRFTYKSWKGESMERTLWHMIMHVCNHETHHRGAISAMLDMLKVDNDYSGMLQYAE